MVHKNHLQLIIKRTANNLSVHHDPVIEFKGKSTPTLPPSQALTDAK